MLPLSNDSSSSDESYSSSVSASPSRQFLLDQATQARQFRSDQTTQLYLLHVAIAISETDNPEPLDAWLSTHALGVLGTESIAWKLGSDFRELMKERGLEKNALNAALITAKEELVVANKQVLNLRQEISNFRTLPSFSWQQWCICGVVGSESISRVLHLDDKYRPVTWLVKKTYKSITHRTGTQKKAIPADFLPAEKMASTTTCIGVPVTPPPPPPYPL
jgi:hypothetical protein